MLKKEFSKAEKKKKDKPITTVTTKTDQNKTMKDQTNKKKTKIAFYLTQCFSRFSHKS